MLTIGGEQVVAIDADAHVIESEDTWKHLEPGEKKYCPKLVGSDRDPTKQYWVLDDKVIGFRFLSLTADQLGALSEQTGRDLQTTPESRELATVESRLRHMDETGIDVQVIHNTLWLEQVTAWAPAEVALCRSYNRWLADVWAQSGGRLRWTCVPPTLTMSAVLEEVRWCHQHGAAGICLRPLEGERHLIDPYFYPLYEEAQRLDIPIAVHIGNGNPADVDLVRHSLFWRFRVPTVASCHSYLVSEVPELFPRLRVGFIETGAQWLIWVLEGVARALGVPRQRLSEILAASRVWVTCEYEDHLEYLLPHVGEDNLLIGTDYAHIDPFSNVQALTAFVARTDVSDRAKRKIVDANPRTFYGITDNDLPDYARRATGSTVAGPACTTSS